jgi:signal peptidase
MRILAGTVTALRRVVDLALIALIAIVLFGLFLAKFVPMTGHQTIIVGGGSMQPAIELGSAVIIGPVSSEELAAGDVVSLEVGTGRTLFTHRIVEVVNRPDGTWVRTKGDANAHADPTLVAASAIIGRVQWTIPWAGFLLALLSVPAGVIFVLGLAATLLAIAWLLESLESDTEQVALVTRDATGGEPIAARPSGPGSVFRLPVAAGGPTLASFRNVTRPTVPEQLARSRDIRARHNRWLAARQHGRPGPE